MKVFNCVLQVFCGISVAASAAVYQYPSTGSGLSHLSSLNEFSYVLADSLGVDDFLEIDKEYFEVLEKYGETGEKYSNGKLVINLSIDRAEGVSQLFADNGISQVYEVTQKGKMIEAKQLINMLLLKNSDLQVKLNQEGLIIVSTVANSEYNSIKVTGEQGLNKNEKALLQLEYLASKIFPRKSYTVNSEDDKTYGVVNLAVNSGDQVSKLVQGSLVKLIKQAGEYGIETVVITEASTTPVAKRASKSAKKLGNKSIFNSEEECIFSTNNCNTHGLCSKNSLTSKWACICGSSFNKTSKSTTHWSGSSCSKIDVSTEFNLIFWSSLGMVLTLVAGVGLLYGVDSEPLPGILAAATSDSFKN